MPPNRSLDSQHPVIWEETLVILGPRFSQSRLFFQLVLACSVISDFLSPLWTVAPQAPLSLEFLVEEKVKYFCFVGIQLDYNTSLMRKSPFGVSAGEQELHLA